MKWWRLSPLSCPHCVKKEIEALGPKVRYIPHHYPNANADVESSHRLIEDEFYSKHIFFSKNDFLNKVNTFLLFFISYEKILIKIIKHLLIF